MFVGPEKIVEAAEGKFTTASAANYTRVYGTTGVEDGYLLAFVGNGEPTGQYLVIRYRYLATNAANPASGKTEIFASTTNAQPTAGDEFAPVMFMDGQWHTAIFDVSKIKDNFTANEDGTYTMTYFRWDIFNHAAPAGDKIDVAYLGVGDDLSEVLAHANKFSTTAHLYEAADIPVEYSTATGEKIE